MKPRVLLLLCVLGESWAGGQQWDWVPPFCHKEAPSPEGSALAPSLTLRMGKSLTLCFH
jgi:hypothetical protein